MKYDIVNYAIIFTIGFIFIGMAHAFDMAVNHKVDDKK